MGYPTICYRHVVRGDERDRFAGSIDEEEAGDLLQGDVCWAEREALRLINVPLTDGQFDMLVSFAFHLGTGAFQRSTLRWKVNREEARPGTEGIHAVGVGGKASSSRAH